MSISKSSLLLFLILLFTSSIVNAASGTIENERLIYSRILVSSDGSTYNDVRLEQPSQKINISTYLELDADRGNTIVDFDIRSTIKHGVGVAHNVSLPRDEVYSFIRISTSQQDRRFERTITQRVRANPLLGHAQDMCNQVAQGLRRQGKTNREIFSRTRSAFFNVKTVVSFTTSNNASTPILSTENKKLTVTCLKNTTMDNLAENGDIPRVKHIKITAEKSTGKVCKLNLHGSLQTTTPNALFTYQLMFNGRLLSQTYRSRSGSNKQATIRHQYTILNDATTFDPVASTAPKQGRFQVVSEGLRSNVASYSINCLLPRLNPTTPRALPGLKPKIRNFR
ncbi:MAG: hypothetical protein ACRBCS_15665 [Cellvibrionaceae bacterium]